ncbi:scavenger receptor class B member 1-like isoform X1, partial [Olea europaea subsp. europaea]
NSRGPSDIDPAQYYASAERHSQQELSRVLTKRKRKRKQKQTQGHPRAMAAQQHLAKFFILANFCLALGLLLNYALPNLISQVIDKQIALTQSSQTYPMWKEPPVPIYQKFYFFNVTNAHDVEQFGLKPILAEVGPFTYRCKWNKRDIEFLSSDKGQPDLANLMSYKNFKTWHFEPELSIADHSLELVTLNAPLAITLTLIQSASNAVRLLVTFSLDGLSEGFFTKRSVRQLLFDGYPDLLTTFGPLLNAEMLSQGGHFGYMNARNNSLDGTFEVHTGTDEIKKLNTLN